MNERVLAYLTVLPFVLCVAGAFQFAVTPDTPRKQTLRTLLFWAWVVGAGGIWLQMFWAVWRAEGVGFDRGVMAPAVATLWTGVTAGTVLLAAWLQFRKRTAPAPKPAKTLAPSAPAEAKTAPRSGRYKWLALGVLLALLLGMVLNLYLGR